MKTWVTSQYYKKLASIFHREAKVKGRELVEVHIMQGREPLEDIPREVGIPRRYIPGGRGPLEDIHREAGEP